jgi:type I restriction enzyme, S subunit
MTDLNLKPTDLVSNLTVAELESLVANIVENKLQHQSEPYEAMLERIKKKLAKPYDPTAPSLGDIALELAAQVPDEEWGKLPKDAAKRYKDYLYGISES